MDMQFSSRGLDNWLKGLINVCVRANEAKVFFSQNYILVSINEGLTWFLNSQQFLFLFVKNVQILENLNEVMYTGCRFLLLNLCIGFEVCTRTTFLLHKRQSIYFLIMFAAACTPTTVCVCVCVCMRLSHPAYMTSEMNISLWTETLHRCTNHFTSTPSQSTAEFDEVCFISCCLGSDRSLLRSHTQPNTLLLVSVLPSSFHSNAPKLKIRPSDSHPAQKICYFYLVSIS